MATTNVPAPTFGPSGFVPPAESAILAGVTADINTAFGGSLVADPRTPQGQLASSETKIIGDANDQFLAMANGVDPSYATGRFQDAIGRIYFIERKPAQPTVCQACLCRGLPGTVLAAGAALAQDASGNLYAPVIGGTITSAGTVVLDFACTTTGPIAVGVNSLSVYQLIPGWSSIVNPTAGVPGSVVESRADFEFRRTQSVAQNAAGFNAAIAGAVLSVPGVLDAVVRDNASSSPLTVSGVTIGANSVYVCVSGGDPQAVAQAIYSRKPPGCGYTGSTTMTVYDTSNGYAPPYPAYAVSFQQAASTPVYVAVTLANSTAVPSNALALVQGAVLAAASGSDGGPRARIGADLFASRFYAGIAMLGPWAQIVSIYIGQSAAPTTVTTQMTLGQAPVVSASTITLALV